LVDVDAGLAADEVDHRREVLGVALAPRRVRLREDAFVAADGGADLLGARLDAEDQHEPPTPPPSFHSASASASTRSRAAQPLPTERNVMRRSSSSSPNVRRTSR